MDNPLPQDFTTSQRVVLLAKIVRENHAFDVADAIVQVWPATMGKAMAVARLRAMIDQIEGVK
jgi:hypothetical protein